MRNCFYIAKCAYFSFQTRATAHLPGVHLLSLQSCPLLLSFACGSLLLLYQSHAVCKSHQVQRNLTTRQCCTALHTLTRTKGTILTKETERSWAFQSCCRRTDKLNASIQKVVRNLLRNIQKHCIRDVILP